LGKEKAEMMRTLAYTVVLGLFSFSAASAQHKFHHSGERSILNYDSLFASAESVKESKRGRDVIESCLDKYGGRDFLKELESIRLTVKMVPVGRSDSVEVLKFYKKDRKFKFTRNPGTDWESRAIKGNRAWFQSQDTVYIVGDQIYRTWLFSYLYTAGPLALIQEQFDDIRYGTRENDSLEYIYMSKKDSLIFIMGIDGNDLLIKSAEGIVKGGDKNTVYALYFEDYKKFDGYYFPGKFTTYSLGMKVSVSFLDDIQINADIDDAEFEPAQIANKKFFDMLR
jgi:hypothetical protein